ncbi:zinc finger protein 98-like isoform X2 [Folsomia candida]|uniref:zinc finger protein 98-like isoform X2 n=1 Tax=Folsomia candida TaxID=158441 RepID=UPI001604D482|nr:zinc finger protein 98-like isoform X2 [Folsomia candida]
MSKQVCLLCLQIFSNEEKFRKKYQVATLCKLLTLCHHNYKSSHHLPPEFEDIFICEFCDDCYPLFSAMKEIRRQISLLEEEIGSKMKQIRDTILHNSSSHVQINGNEKIVKIRDMFLRVTGENMDNFVSDEDEVQVKVEDEEEEGRDVDVDPLADVGDQFLDDDPQISVPEIKEEDFLDDGDDETAFCIIPDSQIILTKPKEAPERTTKRKREDLLPLPNKITKLSKLQPDKAPTLAASTPRSSTRIKKRTTRVESLVSSPTAKIRSNPTSNLESSDEHVKSGFDSDDKDSIPDAIRPRIYKCATCSKSFLTQDALTRHVAGYHSFSCIVPSCTDKFASVVERSAHVKSAHPGFAPYPCRICKRKFYSPGALGAHMVMRHETGEKKLSCVKCGKKFCLEENLARHLKLHKVECTKPIVCDLCDKRFESEERLQSHLESAVHSNRFECTQCPQKCKNRLSLERHLMTHRTEKTDKCPHCDHAACDKPTLQLHIARAHPAGPPSHICHICGKGYYVPVDLKNHLARHEGRKCDTCGETFLDLNSLQVHLVKVHGKDPIVCDECGCTLTSRIGLKRHKLARHAGEKSGRHNGKFDKKCDTCNETFSGFSSLQVHLIKVHGKDPLVCNECGATFASLRGLRLHQKGHAGEKRHKCEEMEH